MNLVWILAGRLALRGHALHCVHEGLFLHLVLEHGAARLADDDLHEACVEHSVDAVIPLLASHAQSAAFALGALLHGSQM